MVVLVAKDGGCEHAVTICGGLIFDSTYEAAIPLTTDNLDWCCIRGFQSVRGGYEFAEPKEKKLKLVKRTLEETVFNSR
jgi:hypothetical protein